VLSERFGADPGRVARIILVPTALSFLGFSGAVAIFAGNG
jgi:malonate transporter